MSGHWSSERNSRPFMQTVRFYHKSPCQFPFLERILANNLAHGLNQDDGIESKCTCCGQPKSSSLYCISVDTLRQNPLSRHTRYALRRTYMSSIMLLYLLLPRGQKNFLHMHKGLPRPAFQRAPGTTDLNPALLSRTKLACVDPSPLPICENFSGNDCG